MIISIISFKGGVAKTTTAIHLTKFLHERGKNAVLIDGDPNHSAIAWKERGDSLPFPVINATETVPTAKHIVIDTPARPTNEEIQTLINDSDLVVIPTTCDVLSIDALLLIVGTLQSLKAQNYQILLTQVPPRSYAARDARELLVSNGLPVFKTEIRRRAVFAKAALLGTTVKNLKDGADAWNEYNNLGKEILKYEK
jgi:chromosome partitioning protein